MELSRNSAEVAEVFAHYDQYMRESGQTPLSYFEFGQWWEAQSESLKTGLIETYEIGFSPLEAEIRKGMKDIVNGPDVTIIRDE